MRIIKEGKQQEEFTKFKCEKCGCEFECEKDEFWIDRSEVLTSYPPQYYAYANCPICHKICRTSIEKQISSSYYYINSNGISIETNTTERTINE